MQKLPKVYTICDMQFGSTGKGALAGWLATNLSPDVVATQWGPNAGHTYIDQNGNKMIHTMLANGCVSSNLTHILIGPSSVVNVNALIAEAEAAYELGYLTNVQILIHPHAAIVSQEHRDKEAQTMTAIGSTKKGTGAAVIEKIMRSPDSSVVAKSAYEHAYNWDEPIHAIGKEGLDERLPCKIWVCTSDTYDRVVDDATLIQVEGAQGYSLGINSGFYPYTTSRECTASQILTDAGIPNHLNDVTFGTMRTFPIRVANRFDENGKMVGFSGPHYFDQEELSWEEVGVEPELTTVTKLPRRIFSFSFEQIRKAVRANAPDFLFLSFCDYMGAEAEDLISAIESDTGVPVSLTGWGPDHDDIQTRDSDVDADGLDLASVMAQLKEKKRG